MAGAEVNDLTPQKQTALHIAAGHDHSTLCSILLENGIDFDAIDNNQNNGMLLLQYYIFFITKSLCVDDWKLIWYLPKN